MPPKPTSPTGTSCEENSASVRRFGRNQSGGSGKKQKRPRAARTAVKIEMVLVKQMPRWGRAIEVGNTATLVDPIVVIRRRMWRFDYFARIRGSSAELT